MAKFVCDYDTVISTGQNMIQAANDLATATNTYSSKISSDLSGWNGEAKNSFITQCTSQTEAALKKAQEISEFGEFIVTAAQSIQSLDDSLASISI